MTTQSVTSSPVAVDAHCSTHPVLKRFAAVCCAAPVLLSNIVQDQQPLEFLKWHYNRLGVEVTSLPENPNQVIEKMVALGNKFGDLIWCVDGTGKIAHEIACDPQFLSQRDLLRRYLCALHSGTRWKTYEKRYDL